MTGERRPAGDSWFRSTAARRHAVLMTVLLIGGVAFVSTALWWVEPRLLESGWVRMRVEAAGPAAPLVFVSLQAAQVVLAPIPGQLLAGVGGYLFGAALGTFYSMVGVTLGSTVVFLASRRYGRPFVTRVLEPTTLERFDGFVDAYGSAGLFVAFLLPAFPDDALCVLAGLTEIGYRRFLVLLVVGRTPTFLIAATAGTSLAEGRLTWAISMVAALTLLTALVCRYRSRISSRLDALSGLTG